MGAKVLILDDWKPNGLRCTENTLKNAKSQLRQDSDFP